MPLMPGVSPDAPAGRPAIASRGMTRSVALRITAGLALAVSLTLNFGIVDLVTAIAPSSEWEPIRLLEGGWGLLFGIVLPIALASQLRRAGSPVASLQQIAVVTLSLAFATILTVRAHEWLLVAALAAITVGIVALHPAPRGVLVAGAGRDRAL